MRPFVTIRPKVARLFRAGYKKKEPNLDDSALSLCCLGRATFVIFRETSIL